MPRREEGQAPEIPAGKSKDSSRVPESAKKPGRKGPSGADGMAGPSKSSSSQFSQSCTLGQRREKVSWVKDVHVPQVRSLSEASVAPSTEKPGSAKNLAVLNFIPPDKVGCCL